MCIYVNMLEYLCIYTLGIPICGNKIDMDRIIVLPVGWSWHEMYLWLVPNEIQLYLSRTFTSKPSVIIEVQHRWQGSFER